MTRTFENIIDDAIDQIKSFEAHPSIKIYSSEIPNLEELNSNAGKVTYPKNPDKDFGVINETTIKLKTSPSKITEDKAGEMKSDWKNSSDLTVFAETIKECSKCSLLAKGRTQIVFGTGNPNADLMVIGEAPGADEDKQGKPFVGRAGQLLTKILEAINFTREEVFIANILKCRPPNNRNPEPAEIENCEPYLFKQLEMIKPKLILALGTFAAQTLLRTKEPLGKLRGKFHDYKGIKTMVTYHPAALLRNPGWKKPTWEDVQTLRNEYDKMMKQNG